jgi:hypothetical protein
LTLTGAGKLAPVGQFSRPRCGGISAGGQAINAQLQGFYNVEHPQYGPEWTMRFQIQFLFPK